LKSISCFLRRHVKRAPAIFIANARILPNPLRVHSLPARRSLGKIA
jgi:hypothetical protein